MNNHKKINVFAIGEYDKPTDSVMSGGAKFTVEILKQNAYDGIPVTVFIPRGGKELYLRHGGDNLQYVVTDKKYFMLNANLFQYGFQYLQLIITGIYHSFRRTFRPSEDILFSSSDYFPDVLPCLFLKVFKKIKWVSASHLIAPNPFKGFEKANTKGFIVPNPKTVIYYIMQKICFILIKYYSDRIIVVNPLMKDHLVQKCNIDPSKIDIVFHGIDKEMIDNTHGEEKIFDCVFLGRFHPQKGIFELIKIWKKVCDVKKNAQLAIIGSGTSDMTEKLMKQIELNKLENNITLFGLKTGEEKYKILKQSKVFLFTSTYESFGIVALEAMACGLPVVANALPEFTYLFPKGMVTVPIGKTKEFADTVTDLLCDDKRYGKLSRETVEFCDDKGWSTTASKFLDIIHS